MASTSTTLSSSSPKTFSWNISGLPAGYGSAAIFNQSFSDGSTPTGLVSSVSSPSTGQSVTGATSGGNTYPLYGGYTLSGVWHTAGSSTLVVPHPTSGISLSATATSSSSIQWTPSGFPYTASGYTWQVNTNDGHSVSGSGTTSQSTSGHASGTFISGQLSVTFEGTTYSSVASAGATTFGTPPPPTPPTGTPVVTAARSAGANNVAVVWTDVSGETGYNVYYNDGINADVFWGSTTSSVHSANMVLSSPVREYSTYTVKVTPFNSDGSGSTGTTTFLAPDLTAPVIGNIMLVSRTDNTVTIAISGTSDPTPGFGAASGLGNRKWFHLTTDGPWGGVPDATNTANQYTFTGLTPDTSYWFRVQLYDNDTNSTAAESSVRTTKSRPPNWAWFTSKVQGQKFNITASEWNAFTTRIRDFMLYKEVTPVTFTQYAAGQNFTAVAYNNAAAAIAQAEGTGQTYVPQGPGNFVTAALINGLRDRLNAIS